jgi:Tfp pilus assembly protein PilF
LLTVNRERWATFPVPDEILLEDAYAEDLDGQWQEALAREAGRGVVGDLAQVRQRVATALQFTHWLEHLCRMGWARQESSERFGFTLRGAWGFSGLMLGRFKQARKALARPYRHDPAPDVETARLAEMDMIAASLALAAQPLAPWLKTGLLAWMNRQRSQLIAQLPDGHIGALQYRLNLAKPGQPETLPTLLDIIDRLGGERAANLDRERFAILLEAYRRLADEAPPERLQAPKAALDDLWNATETAQHPFAEQRRELAYIRARMAFACGQNDEADVWMQRYQSAIGPQDPFAALKRGWFLLDIGRPAEALALAKESLAQAGTLTAPAGLANLGRLGGNGARSSARGRRLFPGEFGRIEGFEALIPGRPRP